MTIVITDGLTLNPGDLDWSPLSKVGKVIYYDDTPSSLIMERCAGADVIVTNKTIIPGEVITSSATLKLIAVSATGYNNIDIAAAKNKGVVVCNVPEYGTYSVAQHTFALLLELVNHVGTNVSSTKKDEWSKERWSYTRAPITELKDKTIGIVGYGRIGKQVGVLAKAFGMNVLFNNRSKIVDDESQQVEMEELFSRADVVSLHCPLTATNKKFVNFRLLSSMKKTALLINTSRGGLIDEDDLLRALNDELLGAAALDVLTQEPPAPEHPLIHHPKCIVTPHNAWISFEARAKLMEVTIQNIASFVAGSPQNVIG